MTRKEKIGELAEFLEKTYPEVPVFLKAKDDFFFLAAVILSAQAQDKVVNKVLPPLEERYKDIRGLASASYPEVLSLIRIVGLGPSKAKNIIALAQVLHDQYHDEIPLDRSELEKLPGIGHKTSGVFLGERHHGLYIPVDTHIERITKRLKIVPSSYKPEQIEEILEKNYKGKEPMKFHRQMILFGRNICLASAQRHCDQCPFMFCKDRMAAQD